MSSQEIPWDKVAKEIVRTLGVEAARGFLYAMMGVTVYPHVMQFVQNIASGKSKDEEIRKALEEIKRVMVTQQAVPSQQLQTPEEIEKAIAIALQRGRPGYTSTYVAPPPAQPPEVPPELMQRIKDLEMEVNAINDALNQLLRQYYSTMDENLKKQLEETIKQRKAEREGKMLELQRLKAQLSWYR